MGGREDAFAQVRWEPWRVLSRGGMGPESLCSLWGGQTEGVQGGSWEVREGVTASVQVSDDKPGLDPGGAMEVSNGQILFTCWLRCHRGSQIPNQVFICQQFVVGLQSPDYKDFQAQIPLDGRAGRASPHGCWEQTYVPEFPWLLKKQGRDTDVSRSEGGMKVLTPVKTAHQLSG